MCRSVKFYCFQCRAFLCVTQSDHVDFRFNFKGCQNVSQCLAENFANITYEAYYMHLCKECANIKKKEYMKFLIKIWEKGKNNLV